MLPYFAVPIMGNEDKSLKYFRDATMKTDGSVTLEVSFICKVTSALYVVFMPKIWRNPLTSTVFLDMNG